jgi:hypothetical protein
MEARSGAVLFLDGFAATAAATVGNFDIEKAWAAIRAIAVPDADALRPKLPLLPTSPSADAREQRLGVWLYKALGLAIFTGAAALFIALPHLFFLWIFVVGFGFSVFNRGQINRASGKVATGRPTRGSRRPSTTGVSARGRMPF